MSDSENRIEWEAGWRPRNQVGRFLASFFLSSAKATYALGLVPCFAMLGAAGFEFLAKWRLLKAIVYWLFACWITAVYAAYLAV